MRVLSSDQKKFRAKKSLGQNFLVDPHMQQRILSVCRISPNDTVLEIGPGQGAITRGLVRKAKRVIAVEADWELAKALPQVIPSDNLEVIHQDILRFDLSQLPSGTIVVSNLPYNIATPVIERIIEHRNRFKMFYMMVQWEYGQRMTAACGSDAYGAFSCFVQYYGDARILFKIGRGVFRPMPKVQSCFLEYRLREPLVPAGDERALFFLIRTAFQQRRKKIGNALSLVLEETGDIQELLLSAGIDPQVRAEQISLEKFIALSRLIGESKVHLFQSRNQ